MMEKNPNVILSIVVAVYNVGDYIERCVASIEGQLDEETELILVDDGSTDGSGRICREYERTNERIKYVRKSNGGLSSARNEGLRFARGIFVSFVDGDDWVAKDYVEVIKDALTGAPEVDIVSFQFDRRYSSGRSEVSPMYPRPVIMNKKKAVETLLVDENYSGIMTCTRAFRRSLFPLSGDHFPLGRLHEDCFSTPRLFEQAKAVAYLPSVLYHYYQRDGSIMHTLGGTPYWDKIYAAELLIADRRILDTDLDEAYACAYIKWLIQAANSACARKSFHGDVVSRISMDVSMVNYQENKYLSMKYRLLAYILSHFPFMYRSIFVLFHRK